MDNLFWDYSLARYETDGVAAACLLLQDEYGLDVNLLLYAAWLAHIGRRLDEVHLEALDALVADWRENVVGPLRALRRRLREYPAAAEVRDEIKSLELRAERQQQDLMFDYHQRAPALPVDEGALPANLASVAGANHRRDSSLQAAVSALAALLEPSIGGLAPGRDG